MGCWLYRVELGFRTGMDFENVVGGRWNAGECRDGRRELGGRARIY